MIFFPLKFTKIVINWLICHFWHLPEKCKYCFIETFFTIFENIPEMPTKFPFHPPTTCLCSVHIAKMAVILEKSVKIFSGHLVVYGCPLTYRSL